MTSQHHDHSTTLHHAVEKYEDRLYSDLQLAARRSLATMTLEEILTNRNRISEHILRDVKSTAATYGVTIQRADVKDLVFPGNLQEIMNKVLAAERMGQVQPVEARTKADVQKIESRSKANAPRMEAKSRASAQRLAAQGDAEVQRLQTEVEIKRLQERERNAQVYAKHPALLRMLDWKPCANSAKTPTRAFTSALTNTFLRMAQRKPSAAAQSEVVQIVCSVIQCRRWN